MQIAKFQELRIIYPEERIFSVGDMLGCYFTQNDLQLIQLKHKHLSPQIHFATLAHVYQMKLVHILVEEGTGPPSQKNHCHPIIDDFGNDHFIIAIIDEVENVIMKFLHSISF